jgi:hypothetical protein
MFEASMEILRHAPTDQLSRWYVRHFAEPFSGELPQSWPFDRLTEAQRAEVTTQLKRQDKPAPVLSMLSSARRR